ncbi:MAG: hypothetical protein D6689_19100, partial [Deltaproteobacteria bacterium]
MFEHYVAAKKARRPAWVTAIILASVAVHAIAAGALIVKSFWTIEKLTPPEARALLTLGPPPPPPPPKGKRKTQSLKEKVQTRRKVTDTVQPEEKPEEIKPEEIADDSDTDDEGDEFGVEGGVEGGVAG